MNKQAVIYARFSDRPRAEECKCMSNAVQEERCRAYCQAYALKVVSVYRDAALGGRKTQNRPGVQQAILHACKAKCALVVYEISRLSRDIIDGALIERQLRKRGASLISVTEHIDCSDYTGRFVFHLLIGIAQMERERTAARTKRAMLSYQKGGRRMSKLPPCGWKLDPDDGKKIVPCEIEQRHIELILSFAARGAGLREICRLLAANGIASRSGNGWNHSTIKKIIDRENES